MSISEIKNENVVKRIKDSEANVSEEANKIHIKKLSLSGLSLDALEHILCYLSENDVIHLSAVCKKLQKNVQEVKKSFKFCGCYLLDLNCFLNYTLSTICTSINLNHCYWLKPRMILSIISKTKLENVHVIECDVDEECINTICDLHLISLSFSFNEKWRYHLQLHMKESIRCFKSLKNLQVFYNAKSDTKTTSIIREMDQIIFHHCKEVEYLKLFNAQLDFSEQFVNPKPSFRLGSTPMPKLKSLVIHLKGHIAHNEYMGFLDMILRDKATPLEHVDFGSDICDLYKLGILCDPRISIDKSTLYLRNETPKIYFGKDIDGVENLISRSNFQKILLQGVGLSKDCNEYEFIRKVVAKSESTLKEIKMEFCQLDNVLDCIPNIAIFCPQITILDISEMRSETVVNKIRKFEKQEILLDALADLSNLKKLVINSFILQRTQWKALSFHKVTKGCNQLTELGIINFLKTTPNIHESVLYDIAHCKNLRVLALRSFKIVGRGDFDLSKITKKCEQLRELAITKVYGLEEHSLDQSFIYAKNLKSLSVHLVKYGRWIEHVNGIELDNWSELENWNHYVNFNEHKNQNTDNAVEKACFNLGQCEKLETIYYNFKSIEKKDCQYIVNLVAKLKNLRAFILATHDGTDDTTSFSENIKNAFKKISEERPEFCSNVMMSYSSQMPQIHLQWSWLSVN